MNTNLITKQGTRIEIINCGNFYLDGGSMFGRVPKTMWEKWFPADEKNRILMATNVARIVKGSKTYLIDAGIGTRYDEKNWRILGTCAENIMAIDEAIDCLICTHLHLDHSGGIHDLNIGSEVIVSKVEWEEAHSKDSPLTKGSYRKIDLDAIGKHLRMVDPPCSIDKGITIIPTPGHTRGHISVLIDDEIFYAGDLIPTASHVHIPCIMAYDLFPLEIIETKESILDAACQSGWKIIFEHDPYHPIGQIEYNNNKFRAL